MPTDNMNEYFDNMKMMKEEHLSLNTNSKFYDEDGAHIWGFSASLTKESYEDDEFEEESVVELSGGIIVPGEIGFGNEDYELLEYESAWQLCDSMSGDMVTAYEAVADTGEGIKSDIINELCLEEETSYESPIMIIQDITATDEKYLKLFIEMFSTVLEGLPAKYCRIVVILLNLNDEIDKIKVFIKCGWKLKAADKSSAVAYKKI